ncbi:uracil-DNA glycosylase [Sulfobacillus thermosulfidooxidans]|uniref:uracil-DNA glycosylase n=1 Tax=Sulfobacillus thermosulfidooxidans TaxID=28034 RepID=UPI0006848909|nr:uracil-DNA glycosylase [Sulfobacillus thermosulfidooxidans]
MYELTALKVTDCRRCRLSRSRTQIVNGSGHVGAAVMFTGEAPGKAEDLMGVGFQGQAGKIFDAMLAYLGLRRDQIWLNNAVRCRPLQGQKNRTPRPDEIQACRPWLLHDVDQIAPRLIITLGRISYASVTGYDDFATMRGKPVSVPGLPSVFPLFHPAYLIYRREMRPVMCHDLTALIRYMDEHGIEHSPGQPGLCLS